MHKEDRNASYYYKNKDNFVNIGQLLEECLINHDEKFLGLIVKIIRNKSIKKISIKEL